MIPQNPKPVVASIPLNFNEPLDKFFENSQDYTFFKEGNQLYCIATKILTEYGLIKSGKFTTKDSRKIVPLSELGKSLTNSLKDSSRDHTDNPILRKNIEVFNRCVASSGASKPVSLPFQPTSISFNQPIDFDTHLFFTCKGETGIYCESKEKLIELGILDQSGICNASYKEASLKEIGNEFKKFIETYSPIEDRLIIHNAINFNIVAYNYNNTTRFSRVEPLHIANIELKKSVDIIKTDLSKVLRNEEFLIKNIKTGEFHVLNKLDLIYLGLRPYKGAFKSSEYSLVSHSEIREILNNILNNPNAVPYDVLNFHHTRLTVLNFNASVPKVSRLDMHAYTRNELKRTIENLSSENIFISKNFIDLVTLLENIESENSGIMTNWRWRQGLRSGLDRSPDDIGAWRDVTNYIPKVNKAIIDKLVSFASNLETLPKEKEVLDNLMKGIEIFCKYCKHYERHLYLGLGNETDFVHLKSASNTIIKECTRIKAMSGAPLPSAPPAEPLEEVRLEGAPLEGVSLEGAPRENYAAAGGKLSPEEEVAARARTPQAESEDEEEEEIEGDNPRIQSSDINPAEEGTPDPRG